MRRIFVTGIGTGVGKTIAAAILTEALSADYWKPIQAGDLDNTDTMKVQSLISNSKTIIHPEMFRLTQPMSPHAAADLDKVNININTIEFPESDNTLIIEGAGGVMVPLNEEHLMIDLIEKTDAEVILVASNYLGSINHTLLTIHALRNRAISITGIIFNGKETKTTEEYILKYSNVKHLFSIQDEKTIDKETILKYKEQVAL